VTPARKIKNNNNNKKEKIEGELWVAVTMVGASEEEEVTVKGGGFTGSTLSD